MTQVLLPIFAFAFVAAAIVASAVILRKMTGSPGLSTFFAPKSAIRIVVIEQAVIDAKRKLVLVRRDDVEHLIMTGGPVDIVIESGIGSHGETRPQSSAQHGPHVLGLAAE